MNNTEQILKEIENAGKILANTRNGAGFERYIEEHSRNLQRILDKYQVTEKLIKVFPNGIQKIALLDKQGNTIGEIHR